MFIKVNDVVNGNIKFINSKYITAIFKIRTGETFIEYVGDCCYTNLDPEDLVLEIERIKNEENE